MGMKRFSAPPALGSHPQSHSLPPPGLSDDVSLTFPTPSSPSLQQRGKGSQLSPHHPHQQSQHPLRQHQQQKQSSNHHHHNHHHHHHQHKHQALLHHHHHHHHPHLHLHHPVQIHDSGKRVKTEQTFESLFDKETHSDITINVNGDEYVFHAHRMILVMKSDVFAAMLARLDNKPDIEITVSGGRSAVPVLHVQEDSQCGQVFSRFLYFLYSGSVWLHPDYVLPLFRLACKYQVRSLREHCQAYILQVLAKSCRTTSSSSSSSSSGAHPQQASNNNNNNNSNSISHNHCPPTVSLTTSPNANSPPYIGNGFTLDVVCDLYEDEVFEGDVQGTAYRLLCCQFRQLVRSERWHKCSVKTVCSLISGDNCNVEENLILMSATDYMKRNNLSDKKQIEDILSLIRYPRLNRRVLYHLQKNGSFKNFPHIQELMVRALMYHSFKDLPEAKDDFVGPQFRPRMSNNTSPNRRASMHVATCGVSDGQADDTDLSDSDYSLDPLPCIAGGQIRQSQV